MLDGLAFLPLDQIVQGMEHLRNVQPPEAQRLTEYFDATYVSGIQRLTEYFDATYVSGIQRLTEYFDATYVSGIQRLTEYFDATYIWYSTIN